MEQKQKQNSNKRRQVPHCHKRVAGEGSRLLGRCRCQRLEREVACWSPASLLRVFLGLEERCRHQTIAGRGAVEWWWLVGENEKVGSGVGCLLCDLRMKENRGQGSIFGKKKAKTTQFNVSRILESHPTISELHPVVPNFFQK